jgi:hypothetical protein
MMRIKLRRSRGSWEAIKVSDAVRRPRSARLRLVHRALGRLMAGLQRPGIVALS